MLWSSQHWRGLSKRPLEINNNKSFYLFLTGVVVYPAYHNTFEGKKNASWHFQPEWEWEGQGIFFATWASPPPNTKTTKDGNGMGDMSYQANVAYMYSFGPTHCRTPCRTHCPAHLVMTKG